ncbi:MAG: asparagine synthase (glutamine-hydrolyzing) [Candidatus Aenigmatarchaeota archaeon]
MCGICGFNWADKNLVEKMNRSLEHRGPDAGGKFLDDKVTLGHRRLAIIDLSKRGRQPMQNKEGDLTIVFNGEIYNFRELRSDLESKGHRFNSDSDTEAIIYSYSEYGFDCVKRFNGMWAFCIYDSKKKILFLSRDRAGKKPLYYYFDGQRFIFASEIKAILEYGVEREIDKTSLDMFLALGFIPAPRSIFKNIFKLEQSHSMVFDLKSRDLWIAKHWEMPPFRPEKNKKALVKEGRELLDDSVLLRKIADVPVGTFLSGGLDSSAVTATMRKFKDDLHTFSIGFEGKYDESKYARLMSEYLGTIHHHHYFEKKDFEGLIEKITFAYDEPFWDFSSYPTAKVSELAKKHVTVVLSGDGGDEVFGGYTVHRAAAGIEFFRRFPLAFNKMAYRGFDLAFRASGKNLFFMGKEGFRLTLKEDRDFYKNLLSDDKYVSKPAQKWQSENFRPLLKKYESLTEAAIKFDLLYGTLADNFLVKTDRATMLFALEARCPFLDYRFMEFSNRVPTGYKVDMLRTKKIMREIIKDRVPKEIVGRGKAGFLPPILDWLYSDYRGLLESRLKCLIERKILSKAQEAHLERLLEKGRGANFQRTGEQIYSYFALANWAERWL